MWNDLDNCIAPFVACNSLHMPLRQGFPAGQESDLDFEYLPEYR